ncbi:hypothetical protein M433DRAFT_289561 [Acidomyces richmondensis BFW]|nr:MAG: hypothetical protein FE78DRAFT_443650 [Acidomyces sp. 'richmondensis']KYG44699.1 hypothetical protein M433DRAFT_289561 [Acidomyces richmondensis BFW]
MMRETKLFAYAVCGFGCYIFADTLLQTFNFESQLSSRFCIQYSVTIVRIKWLAFVLCRPRRLIPLSTAR